MSATYGILCTTCNKKFASLYNLHRHQKSGHNICKTEADDGVNKILCSRCGKVFSSTSTLNRHIRNIHKIKNDGQQLTTGKAANKILCFYCNKTFGTISALNLHIRNIHKIEYYSRQLTTKNPANEINCSHCSKTFGTISALYRHIRNIHKIGLYGRQLITEKAANKIRCSHCSKTFSTISALNLHIRNIHKIRHYNRQLKTEKAANKMLCSHCSKTFGTMSALNLHIRNIHKIKYYNRLPISEKIANDQISRIRINCNQCNTTFSSSYCLRRHEVKFHGAEPLKRKVQKKLQRSPKTTNENDIINNLPANFCYTVRPVQPRNKYQFTIIDFPVTHINDLQTWLLQYCEINKIFLKKYSCKIKRHSIVYKKYFGCGHKVRILPNCRTRASSLEKNTNCPFRIILTVFKRANDTLLARVRISSHHNHVTGSAASVKFRHVSDKVREKLLYLFSRQYTPVRALRTHLDDLKEEYGDEYYKIQGDRYYMPDLQWVYYLHRKEYKDNFGLQYGTKMLETLKEKAMSSDSIRLKVTDNSNNFILSIVTPFMLRIHEEILQSKEMVFIDSTGTVDMLGCKVFLILTNSFSGGLPLGVIITTTETTEAISDGLKMVQELISEKSFGGRGRKGPILFITNDNEAECNALNNVFPEALLLLRQFHVLEAMWRYVWSNSAGIRTADRTAIFFMFKSLMHECDEISFEKKASNMLQNEIVLRYPIFHKHLQDVFNLRKLWASCFRKHLITGGQNTNNLCEASMRIIKEVILNQCRVYSPIELLKVVTTEFEDYFIDKLRSIANRQTSDYLCLKFDKLSKKISDTIIFDRATSKVISKHKEYFIDFEMGLCSCTEGIDGKLCKHLLIALKDSGVESYLTFPETEEELRSIFYIAEGRQLDDNDNWFKPLCVLPISYQNIEVTDHIIEPMFTIEGIIEETLECEFNDDSDDSNDLKGQYEDREFDAQWLNRKLQYVTTVLNNKAKDPVFYQATKQFIHTFEQISHSTMISALHCFGKNLCS